MITKEADYAIRTVLFLAGSGEAQVVSTADMAESMNIPYRFLRKIVRKLADENIVKSARGKGGGVSLIKKKEELSLLQILELFDPKSVNLNSCHMDESCCDRTQVCNIHSKMATVQTLMKNQLKDITFDQLI